MTNKPFIDIYAPVMVNIKIKYIYIYIYIYKVFNLTGLNDTKWDYYHDSWSSDFANIH